MLDTRQILPGGLLCCAMLRAASAAAQEASRPASPADSAPSVGQLVYRRLPYGSESVFSPVTVVLNKGFDHFQAKNASRDFWSFPFRYAVRHAAIDALLHPARRIEEYPGWSTWLRTEVLPLTFSRRDSRWVVNYEEHLIGGGLTYRMLGEWYGAHDVPLPRLAAAITTFGSGILNEAAENAGSPRASASSVADLYVFDLGGILVMSWDPLVRFFAGTLQAANWSNLAAFTVPNGELQNNGEYYIYKIPLPRTESRLFVRTGMGVQFGVSRHVDAEHSLTVALGYDTERRIVDPATLDESIVLKLGGGVYVDRNNSLLAGVTAGPTANRVVANLYPGVLAGFAKDLGLWAAYTRTGRITAGVVHRRALGLGLGYGQ